MSKLASTLVDTSAAPTSPNVLGTEVLIVDPDSEIKPRSSTCKDSTAKRYDRPATTITAVDDVDEVREEVENEVVDDRDEVVEEEEIDVAEVDVEIEVVEVGVADVIV